MEERIGRIYGYCRISTKHQGIGRQQINILSVFPDAVIFEEIHSGGDYFGCIVLDRLLKIVKAGGVTVFELVERYISLKTKVRPTTRAGYKTVINVLIEDVFGKKKISDIKTSEAKMWLIGLQDGGAVIHLYIVFVEW